MAKYLAMPDTVPMFPAVVDRLHWGIVYNSFIYPRTLLGLAHRWKGSKVRLSLLIVCNGSNSMRRIARGSTALDLNFRPHQAANRVTTPSKVLQVPCSWVSCPPAPALSEYLCPASRSPDSDALFNAALMSTDKNAQPSPTHASHVSDDFPEGGRG